MKRYSNHHDTAKLVASLFIILVAFGILLLFKVNSDDIFATGNFNLFMVSATVGMALLIGLLYLINKPEAKKAKVKATHAKPAKTSKAKSKKKKK